jgi:malate dehydrogenase (oxaloacetate-decarboxylating)(NADP+)
MAHTDKVLPFIYTPVIGEVCQQYHKISGLQARGLYISASDQGHVLEKLRAWPQHTVRAAGLAQLPLLCWLSLFLSAPHS